MGVLWSKRRIKERFLGANNTIVKTIGKRLYSIFLCVVNSRINAIIRYKPFMSDRKYIEKVYKKRFGVMPDLDNPKNFNEKNNWRKLYDRQSIYTSMADKYKIKEVVRERCGVEYTFPLLGVWDKPKKIDFHPLPEKFVLKANHAGGVIVCRDKSKFDTKRAIKELSHVQKSNYYWGSREWPYKDIERKIIAESYMGENLTDYKNYCFNGKLMYTFVWSNHSREDGRKPMAYFCGAYNRDWEKTEIEIDYPTIDEQYEKPECYDEMVNIAEKMAKGIPFVRVDCYCINGKPYIGEMTFFPWSGFMKFRDEKWNNSFGELEDLSSLKFGE